MCHHYNKVVHEVCLKVYIDCTKNNQTLTWRISKIIIYSTLAFSVKNLLAFQYNLGLRWYVVLGYAIYVYIYIYI